MDIIDSSYVLLVNIVGLIVRCLINILPAKIQLPLRAVPSRLINTPGWIWIQAASVGELILAEGIIRRLLISGYRVHVTTSTMAGFSLLSKNLSCYDSERVTSGIFPLDDYFGLKPFFKYPPGAFISIETEIWPNLIRVLNAHGICTCVINGRLTERSLSRGRPWMTRAASRLSLVIARDEDSVKSFLDLGAPNVVLGGNLKTDLPNPRPLHVGWDSLRMAWINHKIIVAGSTIDTEEELILDAWNQVRLNYPELRLIIAPRQPNRFQAVADLLSDKFLRFRRASNSWPHNSNVWNDTDILLLDSIGELASVYKEGTIALVGGGWASEGGHNPMEPISWGLPTLLGPGYKNFEDLVVPLRNTQLLKVVTAKELVSELVAALSGNLPIRPAEEKRSIVMPKSLTGALERTWKLLKNTLPDPT